jgi:ribonuclease HII
MGQERVLKRSGPAYPTLNVESALWEEGQTLVAGLDEAGRGPWAGPVYAAAVILPADKTSLRALSTVRDSKTLSAGQRARCFDAIVETARAFGVGIGEVEEIDTLGIVPATRLAMQRALEALSLWPEALILDAIRLPGVILPQQAFPRADVTCLSVAAAGIVAKVSRDRWMEEIAEVAFPGYGFAQHKGYGTRMHTAALDRMGICPLHRRSFAPIAARVSP